MASDVSVEECFRLARAMTWKNAAAGLPHGGGKSVIFGDPRMPIAHKEEIIRAFADAIRDISDYVPGPDMGTDELCMGWIKNETGRAVGLPSAVGGIPLDEIGATGFGLAACIEVAASFIGLELRAPVWWCRVLAPWESMQHGFLPRRAQSLWQQATRAARSRIQLAWMLLH